MAATARPQHGPAAPEQQHHKAGADAEPGPRASGLYADVWEHNGDKWEVTHRFNSGLELDSKSRARPTKQPRVHLPTTSVRVLQQLRSSLHLPGAITPDLEAESLIEAHRKLLERAAALVPAAPLRDAKALLARRPRPLAGSPPEAALLPDADSESHSVDSQEVHVRPEAGREAIDVSVCALSGLAPAQPPVLAVGRLATLVQGSRTGSVCVRYVAVIVCPKEGDMQLANQVGEALATTFMDDDFGSALAKVQSKGPAGVLWAFDKYLSALTIMPMAHMPRGSPSPDGTAGVAAGIAAGMTDALVQTIEKIVGQSRAHAQHKSPEARARTRRNMFVEVDELAAATGRWLVTHRLRQGLDLENVTKRGRLCPPRLSVAALAQLRQLMSPESIALDLVASDASAAMNVVVERLHLSPAAHDEVSRALVDRATGAGIEDSGTTTDSELWKPVRDDEACHVLALTCKHLAHVTAVFARFKSPLRFCLPSTEAPAAPTRFLLVFIGPERAENRLSALMDSLAALATDEDLMGELCEVQDATSFVEAFEARLENLIVVPHTRLRPDGSDAVGKGAPSTGARETPTRAKEIEQHGHGHGHGEDHDDSSASPVVRYAKEALRITRKFSLPLISGVLLALLWSNVDLHSYHLVHESSLVGGGFTLAGHPITLHFLVNDIFMCFFFGLAIKEVTEALLPGGSLSPLRRAVNPLMATAGGVVGPAVAYLASVSILWSIGAFDGYECVSSPAAAAGGHRRLGGASPVAIPGVTEPCQLGMLLNGWGVPTATDISLAWMFALVIFGAGHPAINFLLLLAIVDDAIGMVIIAVCYPDPANPVSPLWLGLVLASMAMCFGMRYIKVPCWYPYIFICGPVSWFGLLNAHVHPALALCFVVPFIPAGHGHHEAGPVEGKVDEEAPKKDSTTASQGAWEKVMAMALSNYDEAPLHLFEHQLKLPVDLGMFFFGLANAGVQLNNVGYLTGCVLFALIVGKTLGITFFSLIAVRMGFGLPPGIGVIDLFAMAAVGGVGLTVALFVANEAFVDPNLQGQAKFAAVLSVLSAAVSFAIRSLKGRGGARNPQLEQTPDGSDRSPNSPGKDKHTDADYLDGLLVDEIQQVLWLQRKYQACGVEVPIKDLVASQVGSVEAPLKDSTSPQEAGDKERRPMKTGTSGRSGKQGGLGRLLCMALGCLRMDPGPVPR